MKLLVILATVALLVWLLRGGRRAAVKGRAADERRVAPPEPMVRCAGCGLHLPAADALSDASGRPFCCTAHRRDTP